MKTAEELEKEREKTDRLIELSKLKSTAENARLMIAGLEHAAEDAYERVQSGRESNVYIPKNDGSSALGMQFCVEVFHESEALSPKFLQPLDEALSRVRLAFPKMDPEPFTRPIMNPDPPLMDTEREGFLIHGDHPAITIGPTEEGCICDEERMDPNCEIHGIRPA